MWYAGFALGLLSSAHCAGMCGPLHVALAAQQRQNSRFFLGRLVFNLGRVATYSPMGAMVGSIGVLGRLAVSQQTIAIASGALMMVLAVKALVIGNAGLTTQAGSGLVSRLKDYFFRFVSRKSLAGQSLTGLLNGILPCGMVYMALAGALAMPSAARSAAFMAAFGMGTLPMLFAMTLAGQRLLSLSRRFPQIQYVLPVFVAGLLLIRGIVPALSDKPAACHTQASSSMPGLINPEPQHDIFCPKK